MAQPGLAAGRGGRPELRVPRGGAGISPSAAAQRRDRRRRPALLLRRLRQPARLGHRLRAGEPVPDQPPRAARLQQWRAPWRRRRQQLCRLLAIARAKEALQRAAAPRPRQAAVAAAAASLLAGAAAAGRPLGGVGAPVLLVVVGVVADERGRRLVGALPRARARPRAARGLRRQLPRAVRPQRRALLVAYLGQRRAGGRAPPLVGSLLPARRARPRVRAAPSRRSRFGGALLAQRVPAQAHLHAEPGVPCTGERPGGQAPAQRPARGQRLGGRAGGRRRPPAGSRRGVGPQRVRQGRHRARPRARQRARLRRRLQVCAHVRIARVPLAGAL